MIRQKSLLRTVAFTLSVVLLLTVLSVLPAYAEEAESPIIQDVYLQMLNSATILDDFTDLRFVFEINSLQFKNAGFVFSLSQTEPRIGLAGCLKYETTDVYESIQANSKTVYPSTAGNYFVAVKLSEIPHASFDRMIYLCAFVEDSEGVITYGEAKKINVCTALGHEHVVSEPTSTNVGTVISHGYDEGTCDICGLENVRAYSDNKGHYDVASASTSASWPKERSISDLTFTPTTDDLLVEFSLCWNEYASDLSVSKMQVTLNLSKNNLDILNLSFVDGTVGETEILAGALMPGSINEYTEDSPTQIDGDTGTVNFPSLEEYGWHRIQIRIHQDTAVLSETKPAYSFTEQVYIDGVLVMKYTISEVDKFIFYKATVEGGEITSTTANTSKNRKLLIQFTGLASDPDFYLPIGDISVTAGSTFVQTVKPASNNIGEEIDWNELSFPGAEYYEILPTAQDN